MSEIPDRIMDEARKAIYDADGRGMIGRERNYLPYRVSRALLAAEQRGREMEREDAAKYVEGLSWHEVISPTHIRARRPQDYAAAIRSRKEG